MGHGRSLINIEKQDDQLLVYEKILKNNLSVRDTEKLVRNLNSNNFKINRKLISDEIKKEFSKIEIKTGLNLSLKLSRNKAHIIFKFESNKEILENLKKFND
jgi:ParB family chromosome partitioning protein